MLISIVLLVYSNRQSDQYQACDKKKQDREKKDNDDDNNAPHLQRGRPLVLEDVQANSSELINVRMINTCQEANFRRSHGVAFGQEHFQAKVAALKGPPDGPGQDDIKVPRIIGLDHASNPRDGFLLHLGRLLENSTRDAGLGHFL